MGELLSNLGNFVYRVLSFIAKPESTDYDCVITDAHGAESHLRTMSLTEKVGELVEKYVEAMEKVQLKEGLKTAMLISGEGNKYLQFYVFFGKVKMEYVMRAIARKSAGIKCYITFCRLFLQHWFWYQK